MLFTAALVYAITTIVDIRNKNIPQKSNNILKS